MQIDSTELSVRLSAVELATFRNQASRGGHSYNPWRASVGQQWHKHAEIESQKVETDAKYELNVNAIWRHRRWLFQINGRIDQLLTRSNGILIREVKTLRDHLPKPNENLIEKYYDYFAQAAIYRAMVLTLPQYADQSIESEVLFINIENGSRQSVSLTSREHIFFERQINLMIPFLEERRASFKRIKNIKIKSAFKVLRAGQGELLEMLHRAALQSRIVLTEAPTGFGKTGILLEHALNHMKDGIYDRCIYLSNQSTGQLEIIRQLKQMIGQELRFIQMRSRKEHKIESERHICTGDERCNIDTEKFWFESGLRTPELFEEGTLTLSRAKHIGAQSGICPYALTKACLPFSDIWIGDSNYLFSPDSRSIFLEAPCFQAERTLLILDEAHNLPKRAADNLSSKLACGDLLFATDELRHNGAPNSLLLVSKELADWIEDLPSGKALSSNELYFGRDLCEDFISKYKLASFNYEETAPFAIHLAWSISSMAASLSAPKGKYLYWVPSPGELVATCLDASTWINDCMQVFGGAILMSATLNPFDPFIESCGLNKKSIMIAEGRAPWRDNAYDVAIDCRVDTRLRVREKYYETTARTAAQLINWSPDMPIAVFFSSYQYAENVQAYLKTIHSELRISRQPKNIPLTRQKDFIDEALMSADALFLVLGSSYAEGIDQMGGRINQIMIVGPGLPEVNLIQKTKMLQCAEKLREDAFSRVYIQPAMRRIHQALGRIVRAPEHRARVLLHGKRFAEHAYQKELAPEYHTDIKIYNETALLNWLQK